VAICLFVHAVHVNTSIVHTVPTIKGCTFHLSFLSCPMPFPLTEIYDEPKKEAEQSWKDGEIRKTTKGFCSLVTTKSKTISCGKVLKKRSKNSLTQHIKSF